MREVKFLEICLALACLSVFCVNAEDPYRFYTWTVTYGTIYPLGVPQQAILINGQFPGPAIEAVTNDNIIVNVYNKLNEPFLITWNGIKQRRTSWQDGVLGTNCPIPPNSNFTYKFQLKDQVGTYTYFPSTITHRAIGGFGSLNINQRSVISAPYPTPDGECNFLVGDWYKEGYKGLQKRWDDGLPMPTLPDAVLINGSPNKYTCNVQPGKIYRIRVSNIGISTSINFRIQNHQMTLIEVEGAHTLQEQYSSIDVHVGQSVSLLIKSTLPPNRYTIIASTRFTGRTTINATATLLYPSLPFPPSLPSLPSDTAPTYHVHWGMKHARTIRLNLTANAARPNPQGSFHYGTIPIVRTLELTISSMKIDGKRRFGINGVSYVDPTTPLKLADYYSIGGVFDFKSIGDRQMGPVGSGVKGVSVFNVTLHDFVEIVFQNKEKSMQSMHLDGTSCYVVGYGSLTWTPDMRKRYNLADAVSRHTYPVFPESWTAVLCSLDNKGMWNLRSQVWENRYLGQQCYIRVWNNEKSLYTEADIPQNALFCGKATKP